MPSEFAWVPAVGSPVESEPRVFSSKVGDGYEAVATNGLNPIVREWDLTFRVSVTVADAIDDFLTLKAGVTPFTFTPPKPHDTEIKVRSVGRWVINPIGGLVREVRVRFRRVFES
ncbi:MAG: phage tail protein [Verrucomicrobia bacterium]|nr:phage tail protein [Verrucomicrobiota bacterium]